MALSTTEEIIESGTVGKVTYDLTFEGYVDNPPGYIEKSHVFLWVNDVQYTVGGGGTEYDGSGVTFTWDTATRVTLVGYSPVLNDKIEFRRTIPTDKPVVDFVDRAGITETMLDNLALSNLYAVHEIKDGFGTGTQNYYALAKLYANADEDYEVEAGQYSAKHWSIKANDLGAAQVALAAAQVALANTAKTGAETAETGAETAQGLAEDAQAAAEAAQAGAELAEDNAEDSATAAAASAVDATNNGAAQVVLAAAQVTLAEAEVAKAEDWAEESVDVEVEPGKYSSKHWATKASGIAASQQIPTTLTSSSGTVNWNLSTQTAYGKLTLTENVTIALPSNLSDGSVFYMRIIQNGTGGYTVSYNASILFGAEDAPVMPVTPTTGEMILGFTTNGTKVECWEVWRSA
jgi:hypothetical protein